MTVATIHQAKTHLSQYLKSLEEGTHSSVVIKRYNRPIARIIPYDIEDLKKKSKQKRRTAGMLKGKNFWISEDFDDSLESEFSENIFPISS